MLLTHVIFLLSSEEVTTCVSYPRMDGRSPGTCTRSGSHNGADTWYMPLFLQELKKGNVTCVVPASGLVN